MSLIICKECDSEYSDNANACPKCGCPTINNIAINRRESVAECSVKINGDEKYYPPIWFRATKVMLGYIVFAILVQTLILVPSGNKEAGMVFVAIGIGLVGLGLLVAKNLPSYKKDKQHRMAINEYFQNRFPVIDALPANCSKSRIINVTQSDHESLMFDVFMEAYKFDADAVVINNSNVATHVSGSVSTSIIGKNTSGRTTSTNSFHMTVTLVKY